MMCNPAVLVWDSGYTSPYSTMEACPSVSDSADPSVQAAGRVPNANEGHRARLRDRFAAGGLAAMQDYEVVELLLTFAIPRKDVKQLAKQLMRKFKNFRGVISASADEIQTVKGMGRSAALAICFIREAASRYLQQALRDDFSVEDPQALVNYCRMAMGGLPTEHFKVVYLDSSGKIIGDETIEQGTTDRAAVYPREVITAALRNKASGLIFVHNHPNGDVSPTEQDKVLTRSLVLAAATVQIATLDHLIVSGDAVFSFRQEGLI